MSATPGILDTLADDENMGLCPRCDAAYVFKIDDDPGVCRRCCAEARAMFGRDRRAAAKDMAAKTPSRWVCYRNARGIQKWHLLTAASAGDALEGVCRMSLLADRIEPPIGRPRICQFCGATARAEGLDEPPRR